MKRVLGLLLLVIVLAGCTGESGPDSEVDAEPGTPAATATGEPTRTTAPGGLDEVPPGFDERPDGAPPAADEDLDGAALTALLRTRASARTSVRHCGPDQVALSLEGFDAAAGHRFTRVVVRNTSDEECVVEGVPGIGVRGAWGSTFVPKVESTTRGADGSVVPAGPVVLAPGERAASDLEWSGELAGAESEPASLLVLQLASGQVPATTPARLSTDPPSADPLDIGQFTTLTLSPLARR